MAAPDAVGLVQDLLVVLNRRDYSEARQYLAEDVTLTGAEFADLHGADAVIKHFRASDAALSDSSLEVLNTLVGERAESTCVAVELLLVGTHSSAFQLGATGPTIPATGTRVAIPVCWIVTVDRGAVTQISHYWDMFSVLARLGTIPADAETDEHACRTNSPA